MFFVNSLRHLGFDTISSYENVFDDDFDIITNIFAGPTIAPSVEFGDDKADLEGEGEVRVPKHARPVYLINSQDSHSDILIAYFKTIANIPAPNTGPASEGELYSLDIQIFATKKATEEFGVRSMLENYAGQNGLNLNDIGDINAMSGDSPGLIVMISCPEDALAMLEVISGFLERGAKFLCIVHDASKWNIGEEESSKSPYKPQIEYMKLPLLRGEWQLIALSPNVRQYMADNFAHFFQTGGYIDFSNPFTVTTVSPVFKPHDYEIISIDPKEKPYIAMVGSITASVRDYDKIFKQLAELQADVDIHIVGAGKEDWNLAPEIAPKVKFRRNLPYNEYYKEISGAFAVIPAFPSNDYYTFRTSASVAAAMIAATPMLVNGKFLEAYNYIPGNDVWFQNDAESELAALDSIIKQNKVTWTWKKQQMGSVRDAQITKNIDFFKRNLEIKD